MTGLLSSVFTRAGRQRRSAERVVRSMTGYELAKFVWCQNRSAAALAEYAERESNHKDREFALFQFLFLGGSGDATDTPWMHMPQLMLDEMRAAESRIRLSLADDRYDWGFRQNIVLWNRPRKCDINFQTSMCVNRMAAVEEVFRDKLSDIIVEVGIAFILRLLREQGDRIGTDEGGVGGPTMERAFEVARQFAARRADKSLTRSEMERVRDKSLFDRPEFSAYVQYYLMQA